MKNEFVFSRAHRTLRSLANYQPLSGREAAFTSFLSEIHFQKEEKAIGLYENTPGKKDESIVITNLGLHFLSTDRAEFISYEQIRAIEPLETKNIDRLNLDLDDGRMIAIPIKGGEGRFRDIFEFLHFLDRVVNDIKGSTYTYLT